MKKPPSKKINVRLSLPLYETIKAASEQQDRSVNAEILDRIIQSETDKIDGLSKEVAELKRMIKQLLDK